MIDRPDLESLLARALASLVEATAPDAPSDQRETARAEARAALRRYEEAIAPHYGLQGQPLRRPAVHRQA